MKIMKKYVAIAAAAILLAGVVYFSCSLNKGKKPVNADADAMPQATGTALRQTKISLKRSGKNAKAQDRLRLNILMK